MIRSKTEEWNNYWKWNRKCGDPPHTEQSRILQHGVIVIAHGPPHTDIVKKKIFLKSINCTVITVIICITCMYTTELLPKISKPSSLPGFFRNNTTRYDGTSCNCTRNDPTRGVEDRPPRQAKDWAILTNTLPGSQNVSRYMQII